MTVLVVATTSCSVPPGARRPLVAPLVLAAVVAAMGISTLICTVARTEEQAGGWNAMVAISLAILAGR